MRKESILIGSYERDGFGEAGVLGHTKRLSWLDRLWGEPLNEENTH